MFPVEHIEAAAAAFVAEHKSLVNVVQMCVCSQRNHQVSLRVPFLISQAAGAAASKQQLVVQSSRSGMVVILKTKNPHIWMAEVGGCTLPKS